MSFGAQIDGTAKLMARLGEIQNVVYLSTVNALTDGALAVHADAVKSIAAHESSGHVETRYNPKRQVDVSEEGHAPNSDRGTLVQSIKFEIDPEKLVAVVGTNLQYGKFLELGTQHIKPRPWLFPALEKNRSQITRNLIDAAKAALEGQQA